MARAGASNDATTGTWGLPVPEPSNLSFLNYGGIAGIALAFESLAMEDESHNSIFPGCLSNGLRYVLEGK